MTDVGYESRNHGFEDYQYYLLLVLPTDNYEYIQSQLQPIIAEWKGDLLEIDRAQIIWDNILRDEIKLKLNTAVQMMQQYYLHLSQCHAIIEKFQALIKSYQLTGDFSVIVNRDHQVRLNLYTLTNNTNWIHFLASKALLHHLMKNVYHLGGRVYIYGLQNTIYFNHFESAEQKAFCRKKMLEDPNAILNPYKLTLSKISYYRVHEMFESALWWRKLELILKLGHEPDLP